jgi:hypothetical protein
MGNSLFESECNNLPFFEESYGKPGKETFSDDVD